MTLIEKINNQKMDRPNELLYNLVRVVPEWFKLRYHPEYSYDFDRKDIEGKQILVLAAHPSFNEFYYVLKGMPWRRFNAVIGYHQIFRKGLFNIFLKLGVIPKKHYEKDLSAVRQMLRAADKGLDILLFPEGVFSIGGFNHPINPGTISLVKKVGATVVLCKSRGSYCAHPTWKTSTAQGRQEFHFEILFTEEEVKNYSKEELYDKLLENFRYNDLDWNYEEHNAYEWHGKQAEGLEKIAYRCPKCGRELTQTTDGDEIRCTACGNRIRMDEFLMLHPADDDSICPYRHPGEWVLDERVKVREEIQDPDFSVTYDCEMMDMHIDKTHHNPYYVCGSGTITIDREKIRYVGTDHGEDVDLSFEITKLPSFKYEQLCRNVFYYGSKYYSFRPLEDKALKYMMIVEEIHNLSDAAWDKACRDAYDYYIK